MLTNTDCDAANGSVQKFCAVTFNIFYALRSRRVEQTILETFLRFKPDVIALQEVWEGKKRNFVKNLAKKIGYHVSFASRSNFFGRKIGLAMLSSRPAENSYQISLSPRRASLRPRILQLATVTAGGARWIIAHAHLESVASFRVRQLQLQTIIKELGAYDASLPVVLLGDFNTKNKREVACFHVLLAEAGFSMPATQPFHTWNILGMHRQLDWIVVRNGNFLDSGVLEKMKGSDHKPVWARIQSRTASPA